MVDRQTRALHQLSYAIQYHQKLLERVRLKASEETDLHKRQAYQKILDDLQHELDILIKTERELVSQK
jgi:DNA invertase Pin-like site-specific DNA recombinase